MLIAFVRSRNVVSSQLRVGVRHSGIVSVHDVVETPVGLTIDFAIVPTEFLVSPERCDFTRNTATQSELTGGQVAGFCEVAATVVGCIVTSAGVIVGTGEGSNATVTESRLVHHVEVVSAVCAANRGAVVLVIEGIPDCEDVFFTMVRAGIVVSERGSHGGYALARPDDEISAAEIIDAIEGPVAITECSSAVGRCSLEPTCQVGSAWQGINLSIRRALNEVSLADLQTRQISMPPPRFRDDIISPLMTR